MIKWNEFKTTKKDYQTITAIIKRALKQMLNVEPNKLSMDLECAYNDVGMDLNKLLASDTGDFLHDVSGIQNFIDRETGKLTNCFLPRCSN